MSEGHSLLAGVREAVVTWGGVLRRTYGDEHGDYAIRFRLRGETFIGVAMQRVRDGRASFTPRVTRLARDQELLLVEFFGAEPTLGSAYVFSPRTVIEERRTSRGRSKKGVPTDWYEVPLEHGVLFGDYLTQRASPPEPPRDTPRPATIQDYA